MDDLDAETTKKAAFAVFAKANEKHLSQDKIESLWPSQHHPHWEGLAEAAVRAYMKQPWTRGDLAKGLAMLDGIALQEIKSTVGDPSDANNWREYLGRADDLLAYLSARCSDCPPVGYPTDETRCSACDRRQSLIPPAGSDAGEVDCDVRLTMLADGRFYDEEGGEWELTQETYEKRTADCTCDACVARRSVQSPTVGEITEAEVERAAEIAKEHLEIDYDGNEPYIRSDSIESAIRAALSAASLTRLPDAGWKLVPTEPTRGRLISMAIRENHAFLVNPNPNARWTSGVKPEHRESILRSMRQLYEEAIGEGFYCPDKEQAYVESLERSMRPLPDALPDTGRE